MLFCYTSTPTISRGPGQSGYERNKCATMLLLGLFNTRGTIYNQNWVTTTLVLNLWKPCIWLYLLSLHESIDPMRNLQSSIRLQVVHKRTTIGMLYILLFVGSITKNTCSTLIKLVFSYLSFYFQCLIKTIQHQRTQYFYIQPIKWVLIFQSVSCIILGDDGWGGL